MQNCQAICRWICGFSGEFTIHVLSISVVFGKIEKEGAIFFYAKNNNMVFTAGDAGNGSVPGG
jgi:hypothetical protein